MKGKFRECSLKGNNFSSDEIRLLIRRKKEQEIKMADDADKAMKEALAILDKLGKTVCS